MTPEQQREVWSMLDRAHLAEVARQGPEPVFATISGAHLYGFASPDSDVDLRGAFMLPASDMLGLHPPAETITIEDDSTIDLDWVAHDIRKFARLMTNHNGYVLEQLFSPLVVVSTPAHEELLALGKGCVTRPTVRHYQGFARGRRKRLAQAEPTVKHLLYAYRVLLTGIHLMQTGEVVANIVVLNERFAHSGVAELVARKRAGAEQMSARRTRPQRARGRPRRLGGQAPRSARRQPPPRPADHCGRVGGLRRAAAPRRRAAGRAVMFPLERHTIFLTLAGSHAQGTSREGSDVDLRGVCIAPLSVRLSLFSSFEQHEGRLPEALGARVIPRIAAHPTAARGLDVKTECVIFDIAKFVRLCAAANPNALEILFADERDWVFETPAWRRLHDERRRFLTRKVQQTFLGYAVAQLKRIKSHRSWLLHPPAKKPSREAFGLPTARSALSRDDQHRIEQSIADKLRSYSIDTIEMPKPTRIAVQARMEAFIRDVLSVSEDAIEARMRAVASDALDIPPDLVNALNAERKYRAALKRWESFQAWKKQRNPARAALERAHGYDTKHAMHLIRLMRMGVEVLERGDLLVRRQDADELSAIRDGALAFDELLVAAARLQEAMERAQATTALREDVDRDEVDALVAAVAASHG